MAKKIISGVISDKDRKFIFDNMSRLTPEQIAGEIGKTPEAVAKAIRTQVELPNAKNISVRWHLKKSPYYKQLREAFSVDELSYIEEQYVKYVEQFKEDIVATEEVQILDFIKIEVLKQRNLQGKINIAEHIKRYGDIVEGILSSKKHVYADLTPEERKEICDYENRIAAALQSEKSRTDEYIELQKQHNSLADKVMGSRDQRVKEILNTKLNFQGVVKQLLDRDKQLESSRYLQLGKLATTKEFERLAEPYKYADGIEDNPVLCAEVVDKFTKQQEQEEENNKGETNAGESSNGSIS